MKTLSDFDVKQEFGVGKRFKGIVTEIQEGSRAEMFETSQFGKPDDVLIRVLAKVEELPDAGVITMSKSMGSGSNLTKFLKKYGSLKVGVQVEVEVNENGIPIIMV